MKNIALLFAAIIFNPLSHADSLAIKNDKWTFGIGIGSQTLADYRGSSYYQTQILPIPFVMYRGDIIKIDRDGARGDLWQNSRMEFNVSVDAALNGHSDNNPLRQGMPTLNPAVEIGPSLNIRLSGNNFNSGWSFRLPVRAIYTLSKADGVDNIGYVFSPKLTWREEVDNRNEWQASFNIGPIFASQHYHEYYYGVAAEFANANRPEYEAEGGYSGTAARISMRKQWHKWWFAAYARYDYLDGAVFRDSPLVEENDSGTLGVAIVRILDF